MVDRLHLQPKHREVLAELLREHLPDVEVWAYGSRVSEKSHDGSDLDLVLRGPGLAEIPIGHLGDFEEAVQESTIPFLVEARDWARLPERFHREIERDHVVLVDGGEKALNGELLVGSDEWCETAIGDLIDITHGFAFKGEYISDEPQGDILLTPGNFAVGGGFKYDKFKYYRGPISDDYILFEGDLIVSMTDLSKQSDTLGYPAFVPKRRDGRRYLHNQRLGKVYVLDPNLEDTYIYYVMCGNDYRHEVLASATGTTVKHTSPNRIKQFRFQLAPPSEQRTIAHILGTLDDKIDLNRRMNETLEAMARALFKSWFVDFDPVRAKMEGRDPGLPDPVADLFPDRLVDSEIGEIPVGWEVSRIGDEVDAVGGGTPNTKEPVYWSGGMHNWATPKDLSRLNSPVLLETGRKITDSGVKRISSGLLPAGTVLLSSRAPIGYLAIAETPIAVNQGFIAMVCNKRLPNLFVLYWCHENLDHIKGISGGSTFAEISKRVFRPIPITVPSDETLRAYEHVVRSFYARVVSNTKNVTTLAQTRDLLLPKLVSGDIRLRDAEKFVEAVA